MSLSEALKASGFKAEANTDGEWQPYKGTYEVEWKALRKEIDKKNGDAEYLLAELDIVTTLEGDQKRDSQYADFSRRVYLDGDKAQDKMKKLINDVFTFAGIDPDMTSDEAMLASLQKVVGQVGFVRAWGWKPENGDKHIQFWVALKPEVAEKKRSADSVSF